MSYKDSDLKQAVHSSSGDLLKWLLFWAVVFGASFSFWYLTGMPRLVLFSSALAATALAVACFFWTSKGKRAWMFVQGARQELRRVHWQSRPEVIQMGLRVVVVVAAAALLIWLADSLFMQVVGLISR